MSKDSFIENETTSTDVSNFGALKESFEYDVKKEKVHYTPEGIFYPSQIQDESLSDESSDDDFTMKKRKK